MDIEFATCPFPFFSITLPTLKKYQSGLTSMESKTGGFVLEVKMPNRAKNILPGSIKPIRTKLFIINTLR